MNHHANARERTTHDPASKPRPSLPARPPRRSARDRAADRAETKLLGLIGRLQADIASSPSHRNAHGYYANGCCAMLEALGIVSPQRISVIRQACNAVLDGALGVHEARAIAKTGDEVDATYLQAVALARRGGQASQSMLVEEMGVDCDAAKELLDRMTRGGILTEPDMFGARRATAVEVHHG